jgi:hypothetical protein
LLTARYSDLCCFAFLATDFFSSSRKEVSKKMPFPVTCPQTAAGSRKYYEKVFFLDKVYWWPYLRCRVVLECRPGTSSLKITSCDFAPA